MRIKFSFVFIFFLMLAGCDVAESEKIVRISGQTMGTSYHIAWVEAEPKGAEKIKAKVDERLLNINKSMSTYDPSSELSLINKGETALVSNSDFSVSSDLAEVLQMSLEIWQLSDGLFDITVGPLVNLWGFGPEARPEKVPSQQIIDEMLPKIGSSNIELNVPQKILKLQKPQYLDLSAIAKGWAVDEVAKELEGFGITSYLVEIGGELAGKGKKPDGNSWRIAIEKPKELQEKSPMLIVELDGLGIATSGDYRNYYENEGVRYSHTIDPRTGYPIKHNLASVTVIHPSTGLADAWATAITVAGPEKGLGLAEKNNLMVYMQVGQNNEFIESYSSKFKEKFLK